MLLLLLRVVSAAVCAVVWGHTAAPTVFGIVVFCRNKRKIQPISLAIKRM